MRKINVETIRSMIRDGLITADQIDAEVIEDTVTSEGSRMTTMLLTFPRFILAEMNTHRKKSKNTGSSRAIPLLTMLKYVWSNPVYPLMWGANKAGMQSAEELPWLKRMFAHWVWTWLLFNAILGAWLLAKLNVHKQWANRPLEPYMRTRQVLTSTEWDNFLELRKHDDAQPEIIALALKVETALKNSVPRYVDINQRDSQFAYYWHLPFITMGERHKYFDNAQLLARLSSARAARTSYLTQEGKVPSIERDMSTFKKLAEGRPIHASPLEHQAFVAEGTRKSRNLDGFIQFREIYENEQI